MNYIQRHWRGELSLSVSFWANVFFLNVFVRLFDIWLAEGSPIEHPQTAARVSVVFTFFALAIVYPWQVVGLWRACIRHIAETGRIGWARTAQILTVIGILATIGNVNVYWPVYKELYQIGFRKDEFSNYTVELKKGDSLIHVQGGLGFGVADEAAVLLANNPNINGLILDSYGGRIYEGRELSKLILIYGLDTYSLKGCYSACTTAFIAGKNRYLSSEANLAFHQYSMGYKNLSVFVDIKKEQEEDLRIFQRQGVASEFLEKLFNTRHDDLWYPTKQEMLDAGVIKGFVNPSDITTLDYQQGIEDLSEVLLSISAFKVIQRYDPETYNNIVDSLDDQIKRGASQIELQETISSYTQIIAIRSLASSSNDALVQFAKAIVDILRKLEQIDPILCLKNLYPEQYGALNVARYLSEEEMAPMMDALSNVIVDAYEKKNPPVDTSAAELLMFRVGSRLGKYADYLEPGELQNREQYRQHCDATIKFYELILTEDKATAGNGLRFAFGQ